MDAKFRHKEAIVKLTDILNQPPKAKAPGKPPRVAGGTAAKVGTPAGTTTDPRDPNKVRAAKPVHGRQTCANPNHISGGLLLTIWEDGQQTTPASAHSSGPYKPWQKQRSYSQLIRGEEK